MSAPIYPDVQLPHYGVRVRSLIGLINGIRTASEHSLFSVAFFARDTVRRPDTEAPIRMIPSSIALPPSIHDRFQESK
jgi:hypothetical protein